MVGARGACIRCEPHPWGSPPSEHRAVRDIPRDKSSVPTAAVDKEHVCPPLLHVCCSLMCIPVSADLLFGLPGRYSGVNLYNRRRVVSYTVTLGLQRYDSR